MYCSARRCAALRALSPSQSQCGRGTTCRQRSWSKGLPGLLVTNAASLGTCALDGYFLSIQVDLEQYPGLLAVTDLVLLRDRTSWSVSVIWFLSTCSDKATKGTFLSSSCPTVSTGLCNASAPLILQHS